MNAHHSRFSELGVAPQDSILELISSFRSDPRPNKLDLGVGVYRDAMGRTPILNSVKQAESDLLERQPTKSYLGAEGNEEFVRSLQPLIFGHLFPSVVMGLQAPGGTGALRLAAEVIKASGKGQKVWVGAPTWPNHQAIFAAVGLEVFEYQYYDVRAASIAFAATLETLERAAPGDVVLLHGCCHNPSGADLSIQQWKALARLVERNGLIPLVDFAYQGFGAGIETDSQGLQQVLAAAEDGFVAYSCSKNFGLYRERVGALYAVSRSRARVRRIYSNLLVSARTMWSMPPDHGAAVVNHILLTPSANAIWREECDGMRQRIGEIRSALSCLTSAMSHLVNQSGMFAMLDVSPESIGRLKSEFGIYMPSSGRINLAGLNGRSVNEFIEALRTIVPGRWS